MGTRRSATEFGIESARTAEGKSQLIQWLLRGLLKCSHSHHHTHLRASTHSLKISCLPHYNGTTLGKYKLSVVKMHQDYKKLPILKFTKKTGTPPPLPST